MARKATLLCWVGLGIIAMGSATVSARGLLGERYGTLQLGVTRPGDSAVRAIDSSIFGFGAGMNWPMDRHVDLNIAFARDEFSGNGDDVKSTAFMVGANVFRSPRDKVGPFLIGRFGIFDTTDGTTEPFVALGGAVQFDLTPEAAVTPGLVYVNTDKSDLILAVRGNYWFTDRFFGLTGVALGLDKGDLTLTLGAGVEF